MNYDIQECKFKLYKNGNVVAYVPANGRRPEEMQGLSNPIRFYRKRRSRIVSASVNLWNRKKKNLLFITYTFAFDIQETDANRIFTNHLKNLKENYYAGNYVWVKEAQKQGRIHFHLLIDLPFIHPQTLQRIFNDSVVNYNSGFAISNNSVRFGSDVIIKDIRRLAKYVSKYAAKDEGISWKRPCYAYTNEISDVSRDIEFEDLEKIVRIFGKRDLFEGQFFVIVFTGYIETEKNMKILCNST